MFGKKNPNHNKKQTNHQFLKQKWKQEPVTKFIHPYLGLISRKPNVPEYTKWNSYHAQVSIIHCETVCKTQEQLFLFYEEIKVELDS